ncbi:MAG: hypothetical protein KAR64_03235 [Thermoplasmatales archaeon]|nr:hypothetical protein [Thermoplasmatales archaeon]
MEKTLLIGFVLIILLGAGAVGTMMTDYNIGMMQGSYRGTGSWGCPMMYDEEINSMYEESEEHMDKYCNNLTYDECKEMHEECEEHMHKYCEHNDAYLKGKRSCHGCPMQ